MKMRINRLLCLIAAVAMVLSLSGCAGRPTEQQTGNAASGAQTERGGASAGNSASDGSGAAPQAGASDGLIDQSEAENAAAGHAGVSDLEGLFTRLEDEDGALVYETEFSSGDYAYDYEIDALTGEIISGDRRLKGGAYTRPSSGSVMSREAAVETALSLVGVTGEAASRLECELDDGDFGAEYEISFYVDGTEYEIELGAYDGIVFSLGFDNRP